jgi:2-succinyl-5-enolpyruvyl-6-hydroxy-3-cyclohexene-1-carboxylate synthase
VALAAAHQPNEISIAQTVVASVPTAGALVVSSSMPVRDVEWFGPPRDDISILANRGANGIDGVVSTAIGVALTGVPTTCLIGDVALLHDSTALVALRGRAIDLTIVVVDNDGGGIFSFLPQHDLLEPADYEQLFGTPHGTDLEAIAAAHGIAARRWTEDMRPDDLRPAGLKLIVAATDRQANLALHRAIEQAVIACF